MTRKDRLANVVRALRESPDPEKFTMAVYTHPCGTPACALGHYAAREDLQDTYQMVRLGISYKNTLNIEEPLIDFRHCAEHFGISLIRATALFSHEGCGNAQTPEEAARFIEQWMEDQ